MRRLKSKVCLCCGKEYIPTGTCSKYCSKECNNKYNKDKRKEQYNKYQKKLGRQVGVGKGGTTGSGKDNPMYKHGFGVLMGKRHAIKTEQRFCGHCGKDLLDATHYQWVIHHKDHNKFNNPEDGSNWILLCKKCHQIEHQCWKAFEGATTSSNERSFQEDSEVLDTLLPITEGDDIVCTQ